MDEWGRSFSHTGWSDPYFAEDHIANLRNGSLLPVVLSFNCRVRLV
ncbi:MAG: hypothetical protein R2941_21260 [Desulfobacterales bacterium]